MVTNSDVFIIIFCLCMDNNPGLRGSSNQVNEFVKFVNLLNQHLTVVIPMKLHRITVIKLQCIIGLLYLHDNFFVCVYVSFKEQQFTEKLKVHINLSDVSEYIIYVMGSLINGDHKPLKKLDKHNEELCGIHTLCRPFLL